MIITNSTVLLQANHQLHKESGQKETLQIWQSGSPPPQPNIADTPAPTQQDAVDVQLTSDKIVPRRTETAILDDTPPTPQEDLEMSILRRLVEMLTGKKINIHAGQEIAQKAAKSEAEAVDNNSGAGMIYSYQEYQYESEQMNFSAQAQVNTADGRQITIDLSLNMSREFYQETSFELRTGSAATDPLVFNFNSNAASLTQDKFSFDIDLDGKDDQIAFIAPGSSLLALDRNNDGVINNGSELFGPQSGDGFAELAEYDNDTNNWIDEQDAIFDDLRIWSRDGNGNSQLKTLSQAGVGAIYLGNVSSPFSINDSHNNQLGQVRSSGMFLFEDGRAGTVQQVDFVV